MISLEKPGTPEELVHFGVKGMKWGVRRSKGTQNFNKNFPTRAARTAEIKRARGSVAKSRIDIAAATGKQQKKDAKDIYLKNPDRATALRLTRGEKVVLALLAPAGPVGIGVTAGLTYRVGKRRGLEE